MKRFYLTILFLIMPFCIYSFNWTPIGPDTVQVNGCISYETDILLISDGLLVNEKGNWVKYSYGNLPVWDIVGFCSDTLLLVLGDGSDSDGIYKFNLSDYQYEVVKWCTNPHFIIRNSFDEVYYVGFEFGLLKSADGVKWEEVEFFKNKNCVAMDFFNEYCVVSASANTSGIYYSKDGGKSWFLSQSMSHYLADLIFDNSGILYGIYPGESKSSGLWKSENYGADWDVEFWSVNMSSVGFTANKLFAGWYKSDCNQTGIAIWDTLNQKLTFLNEGLPNTNIRNIVENQFFDCENITACTDSGAYCLTEFPVGIKDANLLVPDKFRISNYPNPFNPVTAFSFNLPVRSPVSLTIYDINGKLVHNLISGKLEPGNHIFEWNAEQFSSGLYLYKFSAGNFIKTGKCILVK